MPANTVLNSKETRKVANKTHQGKSYDTAKIKIVHCRESRQKNGD